MFARRSFVMLVMLMAIGCGFVFAATPAPAPVPGSFEEGLEAYDKAITSKEQFHPGFKQAQAIWEPLADQGHLAAKYHVGILYYFGAGGVTIDQVEGIQYIKSTAEAGYPTAQAFLGLLSENGDGMFVKRGDAPALAWYGKAAEGGQCAALKRMAIAYENGELGLEKDPAAADRMRERLPQCTRR